MIGAILARRRARQQFAKRNRGDIDGFLEAWAEDVHLEFPGAGGSQDELHGKPAVRDFFREFRERFPDVHFEIVRIFVRHGLALTANNELALEWRARLTAPDGAQKRERGVAAVTIRSGKAVHIREFFFSPPQEAM